MFDRRGEEMKARTNRQMRTEKEASGRKEEMNKIDLTMTAWEEWFFSPPDSSAGVIFQ